MWFKRLPPVQLVCIVALLAIGSAVVLLGWFGVIGPTPRWAGRLVVLDLVLMAWVVHTWWLTRQRAWVWMAGFTAGAAVAGTGWALGYRGLTLAMSGTGAMVLAFVIGVGWVRVLMSPGFAVFGVARTVLDEALRRKTGVIFSVAVFLLVPALPFLLDGEEQLRYRVQFFLSWSLSGTAVLLSVMTVFLACGSICHEVKNRRVYLTLTKPVSRAEYLLGKWLGIVSLNLLILVIATGGVYAYARYLQSLPGKDLLDRIAVDKQVLAARARVRPVTGTKAEAQEMFERRLAQLRSEDPEHYGGELSAATRRQIENAVVAKWHTVAPMNYQRYVFHGVGRAKEHGPWLQMRFKPKLSRPSPDGMVRLGVWLNGRPNGAVVVADNKFHVIDLPASTIDEEGTLEVRIANVDLARPRETFASSVSFSPGEGLEVLYQVDLFEWNLVRAGLMLWIRLAFLTALGLAAGTFLGFPVAVLVTMMVYMTSTASGFIAESLTYYSTLPNRGAPLWEVLLGVPGEFLRRVLDGEVWDAFKLIIRLVGGAFVGLVPAFSEYNPVPRIAGGLVVERGVLWAAIAKVGVVWTGVVSVVAWLVFRRRELARVTV